MVKKVQNSVYVVVEWPLINDHYRLAKNETIVRGQDYLTCLRYIAQNPIGLPIVWEFLRDEWPYLVERFSLNDRYLFPFFMYSPCILLLIPSHFFLF